jgi:CubicO group peptidase (beta-lactamase class C family)
LVFTVIILFFFSIVTPVTFSQNLEHNNNNNNNLDDLFFDFQIRYIKLAAHFPSLTVCIIKNDTVAWSNSYGFSNFYLMHKSTIDTVYRIGSNTKCITATAIMQLYEKGLIDIDGDINNYLPFKIRNPNFPDIKITFRMLLSHQSSIYDYFIHDPNGTSEVQRFFPFPEDAGEWIQSILIPGGELYLDNYWMESEPGKHVRYCSIGYIILGYILELITGLEYEEYVEINIFKPLEMNNSGFYKENFGRGQISTPYIFYGNTLGFHIPLPHISMNSFNPMCGMFTSLNDLSHFFIAHMNNGMYNGVRILNESTIVKMHTIQHPEIDLFLWNLNYGLGWMFANEFICKTEGHGGIFLGYFSNMMFDPINKTGIIFLANTNIKSFKESKFDEKFVWAYKTVGNLLLERAAEI